MTRLTQRRPAWVRFCVVSVTLLQLLCLGGVLPALHFALVTHRVCAEHGALVDAPRVEEPPDARASAPSRDVSVVGAADADPHVHDHCSVLVHAVSAVVPPARRDVVALLPPPPPLRAPAQAGSAHVEIALLLYAPKLAPPA